MQCAISQRGPAGYGGNPAVAFTFAPATSLVLPILDPSIPTEHQLNPESSNLSVLAEAFAREDVLTPDIWTGNLHANCQRALYKWSLNWQPFPLDLDFTTNVTTLGLRPRHNFREDEVLLGAFVLSQHAIPPVYTLGRQLAALERRCAGAGQAVLHVLYNSCVPLACPPDAFCFCRWYHWRDGKNEEEWLNTVEEEDGKEDADEIRKGGDFATIADWKAEMPEWAMEPRSFTLDQLKALARRVKTPVLFEPLIELHSSKRTELNERWQFEEMGNAVPVILEWKAYGIVSRMFDDMMHHSMEASDNTEVVTAVVFDPLDVKSVRKAIRKLRENLKQMELVRKIIDLIAEKRKSE